MKKPSVGCLFVVAFVCVVLGGCDLERTRFDNPCKGVTCAPYGQCVTDGISAWCLCDEGYRPEGLRCVEDPSADGDAGVDADANAHGDADAGAGAGADADGHAEADAGAGVDADAGAGADAHADADAGGDADAGRPPRGVILFVSDRDGQPDLYIMDPDGSAVRRLTNTREWEWEARFSRDCRTLAFFRGLSSRSTALVVVNVGGTGERVLVPAVPEPSGATWAADGVTLYFSQATGCGDRYIYQVRRDGTGLGVFIGWNASSWPDVSPDGSTMVFTRQDGCWSPSEEIYTAPMTSPQNRTPVFVDPDGSPDYYVKWSPDGRRIAWTHNVVPRGFDWRYDEVYVMNADGSDVRRLTYNTLGEGRPVWSPDGSKLAYWSCTDCHNPASYEIMVMNSDGSGARNITNLLGADAVFDWCWTDFYDPDGDGIFSHVSGTTCSGGSTTDCDDNCPETANADQADADGDGLGDACE